MRQITLFIALLFAITAMGQGTISRQRKTSGKTSVSKTAQKKTQRGTKRSSSRRSTSSSNESYDVDSVAEYVEVVEETPAVKESPRVVDNSSVYDVVDEMPSFPGGMAALMNFLSSNMKYPEEAEKNGVQGRVICSFVVEKDGSISNVKVLKSVDPYLDKEAVRVIKAMPHWTPGKQNSQPVRTQYRIPLTFRL